MQSLPPFRGFRPNWLTAALALVLIVATGIGIQAVRSHAGDTAQVDVATPQPFHVLPTSTPFIPTPGTPYGTDENGTPLPLPPPGPTPTATVNAGASSDAILAQLARQSSLIAVVTIEQETIETGGGLPTSVETVWTATVTQVELQRGTFISAPFTADPAHTTFLLFHDSHNSDDGPPGTTVDDGPRFTPGERDVVFLVPAYANDQPCYQLAGGSLGRFLLSPRYGTIAASIATDATSRYDGETPAQLFAQLPH